MESVRKSRRYIYDLDPLRAVTALGVVAVHVVTFTTYLNQINAGAQLQNVILTSLHYTRSVFMFVTAFAMVYVYYGKPFHLKQFWVRRGIGVLIPYIIWTAIYVWANAPSLSPPQFVQTTLIDILNGNASYQLYYILLTIQFYIIFPLFLLFMKYAMRHPWLVLTVSFVVQIMLYYVDYHTLQAATFAPSSFWNTFNLYQNRFVLMYPFYFILGGVTALYFEQVRTFLLRHAQLVTGALVITILMLWTHFYVQVNIYHEAIGYAISVLQPLMVIYCLAVIGFSLCMASSWASRTDEQGHPWGYRFWHTLSDASFGVYLIHALILNSVLKWIVPALPIVWPVAVRVFFTWFLVAGSALSISILLINTPVLSRLVGRAYPLPWKGVSLENVTHLFWRKSQEKKLATRVDAPSNE
ncbi:MAG: acyltransferase [Ktedonobacteraceae bacterium]|nr:acyltransferase [Ktedonobacteraceae bacterium]